MLPILGVKALTDPEDQNTGHTSAGVALFDLSGRSCRWPLGDLQTAAERFCGEPRVGASPYCANHMKKAFTGLGALGRPGKIVKRV